MHDASTGGLSPIVPISIMRCPVTGSPLALGPDGLTTPSGVTYPVIAGVPVLVSSDLSVFSPAEVIRREYVAATPPPWLQVMRRAIPKRSLGIGTEERFERFETRLSMGTSGRPRILVVGGGKIGSGMKQFAGSAEIDLIATDVYLSPQVKVVCDGHHLPFKDESFDGVVIQAVLEHVLDPTRVVDEIYRVLRPNGLVYAETPFMQQVHEGAFDFTRWTESGHRRLFRRFIALERGAVGGPGSALLWSLCSFARSIPPRHSRRVVILEKLTLFAFFWLKYLDRKLINHPSAIDAAAGVYFLGAKADDPIADSEIIQGYLGVVGRPVRG